MKWGEAWKTKHFYYITIINHNFETTSVFKFKAIHLIFPSIRSNLFGYGWLFISFLYCVFILSLFKGVALGWFGWLVIRSGSTRINVDDGTENTLLGQTLLCSTYTTTHPLLCFVRLKKMNNVYLVPSLRRTEQKSKSISDPSILQRNSSKWTKLLLPNKCQAKAILVGNKY